VTSNGSGSGGAITREKEAGEALQWLLRTNGDSETRLVDEAARHGWSISQTYVSRAVRGKLPLEIVRKLVQIYMLRLLERAEQEEKNPPPAAPKRVLARVRDAQLPNTERLGRLTAEQFAALLRVEHHMRVLAVLAFGEKKAEQWLRIRARPRKAGAGIFASRENV
jgi:hypothetical protein